MNIKFKNTVTILAGTLLATSVFAANKTDPAKALVNKLGNGNIKVVKSFPSIGNLEGFVIESVKAPKQQTIVYADKQGRYMIPSVLVDAKGNNVSQEDYNAKIASVLGPKIYAGAKNANWIEEGSAKAPHKAYMVVEPNCSACHMLYTQIKPMIDSGQLAVRWIFVAFMKPQSPGMVAAIMESKDPSKALSIDESKFDLQTETGGIQPINVTPAMQEKIKQNMAFMAEAAFTGTPGIIFKSTDGKPQIVRGAPSGPALQNMINSMSNTF